MERGITGARSDERKVKKKRIPKTLKDTGGGQLKKNL